MLLSERFEHAIRSPDSSSEEFSGYPVLESRSPLYEICALSHELPEVAHILGRHPGSRDEVRPQQLGEGLGIDLVGLDPRLCDGSHFQRMSQDSLEPSFLDAFVDELPDAGGLEDELGVLEPAEELVQFLLGGGEPPLERTRPERSITAAW